MQNRPVIPATPQVRRNQAGIHFFRCWIPAFAGMAALFIFSAHALPLEMPLPEPNQEAAARAIFRELRCVVCQGESINDSNAQIASDMRREIRAQIVAGKTHNEIVAYFTSRYGDFVLMQPPLKKYTMLLWWGPLIVFMIAGTLVMAYFRHSRASGNPASEKIDPRMRGNDGGEI